MKNRTKKPVSKAKSNKKKKSFSIDKLKNLFYSLFKKQSKLCYAYTFYADLLGCDPKTIYRAIKELRESYPDFIISEPCKRKGSYKNFTTIIRLSPCSPFYEELQRENVLPSIHERSEGISCNVLSVSKVRRTKNILSKRAKVIQQLAKFAPLSIKQITYFEAYPLSCLNYALMCLKKRSKWVRHPFAYAKNVMELWMKRRGLMPSYALMFETQTILAQRLNFIAKPIQTMGRRVKDFLARIFDPVEKDILSQFFAKQEEQERQQMNDEVGWLDEPLGEDLLWT